MRCRVLLLLSGFASMVGAGTPVEHTRVLLERTGFTPSPAEIEQWAQLPVDEAVRRWVTAAAEAPLPAPPDWVLNPPPQARATNPEERRLAKQAQRARWKELRAWWLRQMGTTPTPLVERMTLFWHNHFTSGLRKVQRERWIYRQHELLRRHALGNFRELLHAIILDPAMLSYLDNRNNRKSAPNENFARELLELFTLGEGHYSERDIKAAARALTGWRISREGEVQFDQLSHDDTDKQFLGRNGAFEAHDIVDIILDQPRAAEFIVEKLWREFVSAKPYKPSIRALAAQFRRDYEIAPLLIALFQEPALFAEENRGTLIKSPVELVVGSLRMMSIQPGNGGGMVAAATAMGQQLFEPPNVKGWPGGTAWINSTTLLARHQFIENLSGEVVAPAEGEISMPEMTSEVSIPLRAVQRRFSEFAESLDPAQAPQLVLAVAPIESPIPGATPGQRLRAWMLDPAYEVK